MTDFASLRFACPHCDQHIECELAWAGMELNCPTCAKPIRAPAPAPAATASASSQLQPKLVRSAGSTAARPTPIREQVQSEQVKRAPDWMEKAASYSVVAPITGVCLVPVLTKNIPTVLRMPLA